MRRGRAVGAPAATARRRAPRPDCSVWRTRARRPTVTQNQASSRSLLDHTLSVPPDGCARLARWMPRGPSDPPARSGARRDLEPASSACDSHDRIAASTTSGPRERRRGGQAAARLAIPGGSWSSSRRGRLQGAHTRPPRQSAGRSRAGARSRLRDREARISARRACDRRARARPRRRGRRRARALLGPRDADSAGGPRRARRRRGRRAIGSAAAGRRVTVRRHPHSDPQGPFAGLALAGADLRIRAKRKRGRPESAGSARYRVSPAGSSRLLQRCRPRRQRHSVPGGGVSAGRLAGGVRLMRWS